MGCAPLDAWQAIARRDPRYDGTFVFAVRSTGIFCRPSCPARRPNPNNVRIFSTPKAATREGFRACRRCRPGLTEVERMGSSLAFRVCSHLRKHLTERITLQGIADVMGLSPQHLQKTFKKALGVSPLTYLKSLRFEEFRRSGGAPGRVYSALYSAGFGSPSRLYENAKTRLGMTPAAYLKGGVGMTIDYDLFTSRLGRVLIAATPLGICAVELGRSDAGLVRALRARFPKAALHSNPRLLRKAGKPLRGLFEGEGVDHRIPLDVLGTAFQARVWKELRSIPAGSTASYSEIARRIDRPNAARAVARACASNPVAILIPCHRAVGVSGRLAGYRWGVRRKQELLRLEQAPHRRRERDA
jgi:AraC family transcriptional regulator of adaptative response/methylated-DNA-[protein]-cysteine methyltransferase